MLKTIDGLQYIAKSPSSYRLIDTFVNKQGWSVEIDYIGPTLQWRIKIDSPEKNMLTKCFLDRDQVFRIVSDAVKSTEAEAKA